MPLQAAKDMLSGAARRVRTAADDILTPAYDAIDRASLSDSERKQARDSDPDFRKADDEFQEHVRSHRRRRAVGQGDR